MEGLIRSPWVLTPVLAGVLFLLLLGLALALARRDAGPLGQLLAEAVPLLPWVLMVLAAAIAAVLGTVVVPRLPALP